MKEARGGPGAVYSGAAGLELCLAVLTGVALESLRSGGLSTFSSEDRIRVSK